MTIKKIFLFCFFASGIASTCLGGTIDSPYIDTFDSYGTQNMNPPTFGPFYTGNSGTCHGGEATQLTPDAAMGGAGKGVRWWMGNAKNDNSGSFTYWLNTPTNEIWVRFYKRYASGLAWKDGAPDEEKVVWFVKDLDNMGDHSPMIYGHSRDNCWDTVNSTTTTDASYAWVQTINALVCGPSDTGWKHTQGGAVGDGKWHAYEVHFKKATNSSTNDGVVQVWVDGQITINRTNIPTGADTDWPRRVVQLQVNQDSGDNATCAPVDVDNIAIYTSTPPRSDSGGRPFIGLVSGDTTPPSVSITSPNPAIITSDFFAVTATASDDIGVDSCKWRLGSAPNDSSGTACSGASSVSCSTSGYSSGANNLYVGCKDAAGNWGTSSMVVNYSPPSGGGGITPTGLIMSEAFETAISGRAPTSGSGLWIDGAVSNITSSGYAGNAVRFSWAQGAQQPTNSTAIRYTLPTDQSQLFVRYYVKYATGWRGSGQSYHPHMFYVLSNQDVSSSEYSGPANSYLDAYIEAIADTTSPHAIRPQFAYQDQKRVNTSNGTPPNDLRGTTESRSTGQCNQPVPSGWGGDCYADQPYYSSASTRASSYAIQTGQWAKVETFMKMNSVVNGIGVADGQVKMWVDGNLVINSSDVMFRTGQNPSLAFRQLVLSPYIGDGSPISQTVDIDSLEVYSGYSGSTIDTTAPTVSITTANPSSTVTGALTVSGSATDNVGVSSCKWRVGSEPDASNGTACTGASAFSCATTGYSSGSSALFVGCTDAAGNWGSSSISVNYTPTASQSTNLGTIFLYH